jgi:pyruvate kinase
MYAANHFPGVKAIIALTESGYTPLIMSRIRSAVPIYCYSPHSATQNRAALFRGVYTVPFAPSEHDPAELSTAAIRELKKRGRVFAGDWVILTKGDFYRDSGGTNGMKILKVD